MPTTGRVTKVREIVVEASDENPEPAFETELVADQADRLDAAQENGHGERCELVLESRGSRNRANFPLISPPSIFSKT